MILRYFLVPGENQHVLFFNALDHDWSKPKTSTEPLAVLLRYLQNFKYPGYRSGIHAWGSNPQKSRHRKVLIEILILKLRTSVLLPPNMHKNNYSHDPSLGYGHYTWWLQRISRPLRLWEGRVNSFMTFKSLPTDKTTAPSKSARIALLDPDHLAKAPAL